jgi:hypothetical protein
MQSAAENGRIQKILARILEEKGLVSNLDNTLTDAHLKALLKRASNSLGDVENLFLDTKILQETRTDAALADWLGQAERELQHAVQQRKFVEDIVKKYGPNARTIPA